MSAPLVEADIANIFEDFEIRDIHIGRKTGKPYTIVVREFSDSDDFKINAVGELDGKIDLVGEYKASIPFEENNPQNYLRLPEISSKPFLTDIEVECQGERLSLPMFYELTRVLRQRNAAHAAGFSPAGYKSLRPFFLQAGYQSVETIDSSIPEWAAELKGWVFKQF